MFSRLKDRISLRIIASLFALSCMLAFSASPSQAQEYTADEIVESGHRFFGATSGGLASVVEHIFASYGLPNGYVLGEEGSGAIVGGLTYGEGTLYTKNAGDHKVFWQGPSLGWDFGGQGSRSMILVYNLDDVPEPLQPLRRRRRFGLCRGRPRLQRAEERQHPAGAGAHRRRRPPRRQCRLSEADRTADLESVLTGFILPCYAGA